ncbi:hypothetical protein EZV62_024717 [Acer yangbiense]|uniref:Ubiquitin-like protease family profile domain-containing protein n=1 Tax=Acer yangbiense TaxID=1000413 RepID=A0A5C7GWY7_9ROSI|nr:hypothetical protein EZV62_024717 [Acer yangbiense]
MLCMTKEIGRFLGSIIGDVWEVDVGPSGDCLGKFLRVRVAIEVDKPLRRFLRVDVLGDGEKTGWLKSSLSLKQHSKRNWGGNTEMRKKDDNRRSYDVVEKARRYRQRSMVVERDKFGKGVDSASRNIGKANANGGEKSSSTITTNLHVDSGSVSRDQLKGICVDSEVLEGRGFNELNVNLKVDSKRDLRKQPIGMVSKPMIENHVFSGVNQGESIDGLFGSPLTEVGLTSSTVGGPIDGENGLKIFSEKASAPRPIIGNENVIEGVRKLGIIFTDEGIGPSGPSNARLHSNSAIGPKTGRWKRAAKMGKGSKTQLLANDVVYGFGNRKSLSVRELEKKIILIPCCVCSSHWVLCELNLYTYKIEIYDSLQEGNDKKKQLERVPHIKSLVSFLPSMLRAARYYEQRKSDHKPLEVNVVEPYLIPQ